MKAPLLIAQGPHPIPKFSYPTHIPQPLPYHPQIQTNVAQTVFYTMTGARTLYA